MIQLDAPDPLRTPSLSIAARTGNVRAVRNLLKQGRRADSTDNRGWTPLHEAASAGHVTCVKLLLSHDSDIKDAKTYEGETPLFLSINEESKLDVLKVLVNHSADVNLGNNEDFTPLHKACELNSLGSAKLLLESGADVNAADVDGDRPIHEAINKRSVEMVDLLLRYGADLRVKNSNGLTPLISAAYVGFHEVIKKLDQPKLHLINKRASSGRTALMMAAQRGYLKTTKALLEMGADANILSEDKRQTALHLASHGNDPRLVECLVDVTDVQKVARRTEISPLILAIDSMHLKSIELVLEWMNGNSKLMRNIIDFQSDTLWKLYSKIGTVSFLLYNKAEMPEVLPVLQLLLEYGFSTNAINKHDASPLSAIVATSAPKEVKKQCIQILLDHGANVDDLQKCPVHNLTSLPGPLYVACDVHPGDDWLIRMLLSASRSCDPNSLMLVSSNAVINGGDEHPPNYNLQFMLDLALELGISRNHEMSIIWRQFRGSAPPAEILQSSEDEEEEEKLYLRVPEFLTPTSLSKLCRIAVRSHYSPSQLKKLNLPSVINDFLNYVF